MGNSSRKLATVETIASIHEIPDADAIVRARVRGWDVVVKKGEFQSGDRCVFVEIDAMLDVSDPRFAFLAPRGLRFDAEGRQGHVLKTARLRGQYSQGLALPAADFPEATGLEPGDDLTEKLGVVLYEAPVPAQIGGQVRGMRPIWIPKTDEDRIQNRRDLLQLRDLAWTATEKVDGSSCSVYRDPTPFADGGEVVSGVCSRNLDLVEHDTNTMWRLARKLDLHQRLAEIAPRDRAVVQGEVYGEGIQGNPLKVKGQHFAAFGLLVDGHRIPLENWPAWLTALSVPVFDLPFPATVDEALAQVDGIKSLISPDRSAEGVVWRAPGPEVEGASRQHHSAKAISNRYLLKHDR